MAQTGELEFYKARNPDYNWPERGPRRNYPEDEGKHPGATRYFGIFPMFRKYTLIMRTSREVSAIERASEDKHSIITYNPIRLETYGVWIRGMK